MSLASKSLNQVEQKQRTLVEDNASYKHVECESAVSSNVNALSERDEAANSLTLWYN